MTPASRTQRHTHPDPSTVPATGDAPPPHIFRRVLSVLVPVVTVLGILGIAAVIIAYGRGYRFNVTQQSLQPTGLLVAHSEPPGAQIIIDGTLKTATPATLTMPPGWYTVTIVKEGYQQWEKRVKVQGEVVAKADALLLPINPSLTALTASGVLSPTLSPDGARLAYIIPDTATQATSGATLTITPGIWVLDLVDKPLGLNRDARQLARAEAFPYDADAASLAWSPDSKQVLVTNGTLHHLLEADRLNPAPLSQLPIKTIQTNWQRIKLQRDSERLATVPKLFTDIATVSASILAFSPDETKILYEATASAVLESVIIPPLIGTNPTEESRTLTPGTVYVYDIKEDRNYELGDIGIPHVPSPTPARARAGSRTSPTPVPSAPLPALLPVSWLPDSQHFVIVRNDKVEIIDYDGTNRRTVYAGPFWDSFAVPWAAGGKLVILTNLNPSASAVNNLYVVNLK